MKNSTLCLIIAALFFVATVVTSHPVAIICNSIFLSAYAICGSIEKGLEK